MPDHEDKSTVGERLTGVRDPKDPDGLLTVDQSEAPPSRTVYGHEETDTLAVEGSSDDSDGVVQVPEQNGITSSDTVS